MTHKNKYVNRLTNDNIYDIGVPGVSQRSENRYSGLGDNVSSNERTFTFFSETPGIRFSWSAEFFSAKNLTKTLFEKMECI